jgi:hypothetical protein
MNARQFESLVALMEISRGFDSLFVVDNFSVRVLANNRLIELGMVNTADGPDVVHTVTAKGVEHMVDYCRANMSKDNAFHTIRAIYRMSK